MHRKPRRPAHCAPGSITDTRQLGERLRVSRERLAASELATSGMAWRLWAACVDATVGYARQADQVYATTLGGAAGVHRSKVGALLRRFDELGVFGWDAAPRGSHGISELRLPDVMYRPRCTNGPHVCTAHGSLQSNGSEFHRSTGIAIETEQVGTEIGAPTFRAVLEGLTIDELHDGMARYGPAIAELYAEELERRNIAPRRRPAWLDH